MDRKIVTAAIISNNRGEILVTRRRETEKTPGGWEFPGGKLEHGESIEECLKREIDEELGIEIAELDIFHALQHKYPSFTIVMIAYRAILKSGIMEVREHEDARWLAPGSAEWKTLDFLPADIPIVEKLLQTF